MNLDDLSRLHDDTQDTTIALVVIDGLGGLPASDSTTCATELEAAATPNLDELAAAGSCGLQIPVASGVTPGSGPGHLGVFGYDPLEYRVGRGVLSALGIEFDLRPGDVAARGNFCTLDDRGSVTDRRAGRIETELNQKLCDKLNDMELEGVEVIVETVKEHRFLLVLRGDELSGDLEDTDPQEIGVEPHEPRVKPTDSGRTAERTAGLVRQFVRQAEEVLADETPANGVLLRGFDQRPTWPTVGEAYGLNAACLASYPMYRGVASLVGMDVLECGDTMGDKIDVVRDSWADRESSAGGGYDFFFLHEKRTDKAGEDGDFDQKVTAIEQVDGAIPDLMAADPDVVVVTGDHSTPSAMKSHSWHPVPVLIHADRCRADRVDAFGETVCRTGSLGARLPACELMPLALANAGRLDKFGA